ncbi:MAG: hypothetical protein VXW58_00740, partial [Pseudomonadota bacterium]|nr:hypothetical protein [Pseudomonadota bacterium]
PSSSKYQAGRSFGESTQVIEADGEFTLLHALRLVLALRHLSPGGGAPILGLHGRQNGAARVSLCC